MNLQPIKHRVVAICAVIALATVFPASTAIATVHSTEAAAVMNFSKSGNINKTIEFTTDDFRIAGSRNESLDSIILTSLPSRDAGTLMLGDRMLSIGDIIAFSALDGIRFLPSQSPQISNTSFSFIPVFQTEGTGNETKVHLYLLEEENSAPTAENIEFTTYKNVAYTGLLNAIDPEGDMITFQIIDKPARGSIEFSDTNEAEFIYSPYENKTGRDSFTYVAIDAVGNKSSEATVKIKIEKPSTKVTYADMVDHPAYCAAIRLAEEKIFIGSSINGTHYFNPDTPLTRSEFLAMAMEALDEDILTSVSATGFHDDDAIQTWAKPYVASALKSGSIQGRPSSDGHISFCGNDYITQAEAAVLINRMLSVSDVSVETWSGNTSEIPSWASQAVMNLETVGVLKNAADSTARLSSAMTRADAASMISAALDVLENRENSSRTVPW